MSKRDCSSQPRSERRTAVGKRVSGQFPVLCAAVWLVLIAQAGWAQNFADAREAEYHQASVSLEHEVGEFLRAPDAGWFDARKDRLDRFADDLAEEYRTLAKNPNEIVAGGPCRWSYLILRSTVLFARFEHTTKPTRKIESALAAFDSDLMVNYLEQMRICEVIGRVRNRQLGFQSKAIQRFKCLETGVGCEERGKDG